MRKGYCTRPGGGGVNNTREFQKIEEVAWWEEALVAAAHAAAGTPWQGEAAGAAATPAALGGRSAHQAPRKPLVGGVGGPEQQGRTAMQKKMPWPGIPAAQVTVQPEPQAEPPPGPTTGSPSPLWALLDACETEEALAVPPRRPRPKSAPGSRRQVFAPVRAATGDASANSHTFRPTATPVHLQQPTPAEDRGAPAKQGWLQKPPKKPQPSRIDIYNQPKLNLHPLRAGLGAFAWAAPPSIGPGNSVADWLGMVDARREYELQHLPPNKPGMAAALRAALKGPLAEKWPAAPGGSPVVADALPPTAPRRALPGRGRSSPIARPVFRR